MKQRLQAWGNSKVLPIAGCFILNERGEVLLLKRHKLDLGGGKWGTPGGRVEPDELPLMAAERKVLEETGLTLKLQELGEHLITMPHGTVHMTSFVSRLSTTPEIILDSQEHDAATWFKLSELATVPEILWGIPSLLHDFGFLKSLKKDTTLNDRSSVKLLKRSA